jgi:hypothetical protein
MVLDGDIRMEAVTRLMEKYLTGHFMGKQVKGESLRIWMRANWEKISGYLPKFHYS